MLPPCTIIGIMQQLEAGDQQWVGQVSTNAQRLVKHLHVAAKVTDNGASEMRHVEAAAASLRDLICELATYKENQLP